MSLNVFVYAPMLHVGYTLCKLVGQMWTQGYVFGCESEDTTLAHNEVYTVSDAFHTISWVYTVYALI